MAEFTNKSFDYTDIVAGIEYKIKVLIVSAPDDIQISNMDTKRQRDLFLT